MKNANYDMICAKASNMDLVVFVYNGDTNTWEKTDQFPINNDARYFMCLPCYETACLTWLNHGKVEVGPLNGDDNDFHTYMVPYVGMKWKRDSDWMNPHYIFRLVPDKVTKWVGVFKKDKRFFTTELLYNSVEELKTCVYSSTNFDGWQFVEIEVDNK